MHRTRIPLTTWVGAALWVLQRDPTASTGSLQEEFGIGSNNTARSLLRALESWMLPDSEAQLSGVVQVESVEISGKDRGCTSHSTIDQLDEFLVAVEVRKDGSRGDLRVSRIPPDVTEETAQVSRWEFVHRAIAPAAEPEFGEGFRVRQKSGVFVDQAGPLDPAVRDTYDRWGGTARTVKDAGWVSRFADRIRAEFPVEEGCVSRNQIEHYVLKAQFLWRYKGEHPRKRLRRLFSRALAGRRRKDSADLRTDDGPSDSPADREAATAKTEDLSPGSRVTDDPSINDGPSPPAEALGSGQQFDLFGDSS